MTLVVGTGADPLGASMAQLSGTRRVRMVGAEHWTDVPERDLPTLVVGADTYAIHERRCVDSARVRLVLADGEDAAAALRDLPGELVRDVRVFRLVDSSAEVVEALPEWRLTLPPLDDPEHDPLPALVTRLSGWTPPVEAPEVVEEPTPVVDDVVAPEPQPAPPVEEVSDVAELEAGDDGVPALEPLVVFVPEPEVVSEAPLTAESLDPYAVPAETSFPTEAEHVDVAPALEPVAGVPVEAVALATMQDAPQPSADGDGAPDVAAEQVADVPEEPAEPDPRDLEFAPTAAVLEAGSPVCAALDREGGCASAADVVWQTPAGASWACAWHWPSTMAGHAGAEVGAVKHEGGWTTWRDGDSVELARRGADLFVASAREHDKPVSRPLVALDALDDMLKRLPDDLRGAMLLWSIAVTNPEWETDVVVEHGRVTLEEVALEGRAVAYPDELYFQEQAAIAPIIPVGHDAEGEPPAVDGDRLFAQGNAAAASGDLKAAASFWTQAADLADHPLAMRAMGDLTRSRDDLKGAEEWYGRAAFLNDAPSMTRIGTIYIQKGQSDRAAEWLRRAARFGDEEASRHLESLVAATA